MGCVLTAGVGQGPARQAAVQAGLPDSVPCTVVNKGSGSGLEAVLRAAQAIRSGDADVVVAGGMENMSLAPYLVPGARDGLGMGHRSLIDSMVHDGLWDVYHDFHMAIAAERCSQARGVGRPEQDELARTSYTRAITAQRMGRFVGEIAPVSVPQRRGDPLLIETDQEPERAEIDRFHRLRPAYKKGGTVTAANAASHCDGAAALVLAGGDVAASRGWPVHGHFSVAARHAGPALEFAVAPADALSLLLTRAGLTSGEIDLYEIHESYAVAVLAVQQALSLPTDRVNVRGGAAALGHPLGATGARMLVTLLHTMKARDARRGAVAIGIGGGEALAALVVRPDPAESGS